MLLARDSAAAGSSALHALDRIPLSRVIGGERSVERRQVIQIGYLSKGKRIATCSASLLSDDTAASAAHCIHPGEKMVAWIESADGSTRSVVDLACEAHPRYPKRKVKAEPVLQALQSVMLWLAQAVKIDNHEKSRKFLEGASAKLKLLVTSLLPATEDPKLVAHRDVVSKVGEEVRAIVLEGDVPGEALRRLAGELDGVRKQVRSLLSMAQSGTSPFDIALCAFRLPKTMRPPATACLAPAKASPEAKREALLVGFGCERAEPTGLVYTPDEDWSVDEAKGLRPRVRNEGTVSLRKAEDFKYEGSWDPGAKTGEVRPGEVAACGGDSGGFLGRENEGPPKRLQLEAVTITSGALGERFDFDEARFVHEYKQSKGAVGGVDLVDRNSPARRFLEGRATAENSPYRIQVCDRTVLAKPVPLGGATLPKGFTRLTDYGGRPMKLGDVFLPKGAVGYRIEKGSVSFATPGTGGRMFQSLPVLLRDSVREVPGASGGTVRIPAGFRPLDQESGRVTRVGGFSVPRDVAAYRWESDGRLLLLRYSGRQYFAAR